LKGKQLGDVLDEYFSGKTKYKDAIIFPAKDAKPEEIDAFLKRMNIPISADDYKLDPKAIPGNEADETKTAAVKELADFFKSIGLTQNQAKKTFEQFTGFLKGANEAETTKQKALAESFNERLTKELGGDEKSAIETTEYFKRALIALGDKKLVQELKDSGMLYSTAFVRGMADIFKAGNQEPPIPQAGPVRDVPKKDALPKSKQFDEKYGGKK